MEWEVVVLLAVFALVGLVRPRWSSLYAVGVAAALPLVWVIWGAIQPARSLGYGASWYVTVGAIYAALAAAACVVGIATGRVLRKSRRAHAE
jgi:hypothetical protein